MTDPTPEQEPALCRFAVLRHSDVDEPHFDFLFEAEAVAGLVTFRLPAWPLDRSQWIQRLKDHRRVYLDFEGAIPGGRGRVDRVAEGQVRVLSHGAGFVLLDPLGRPWLAFEPGDAENAQAWWVQVPRQNTP